VEVKYSTSARILSFAGAERRSRVSQGLLNPHCVWVRAAKHAPRNLIRVLERRHGLAEIVERGAVVLVERHRVESILNVQTNLAMTYEMLGRDEQALQIDRDVYSGRLKLHGKEDSRTLLAANNYAWGLSRLQRFAEVKALLRKTLPVARRLIGDNRNLTLTMRWNYALALYEDPDATLDDLREAVTTLEETERTARRVLGGANPTTRSVETDLRNARAALRARETPPQSGSA